MDISNYLSNVIMDCLHDKESQVLSQRRQYILHGNDYIYCDLLLVLARDIDAHHPVIRMPGIYAIVLGLRNRPWMIYLPSRPHTI